MEQGRRTSDLDDAIEDVRADLKQEFACTSKDYEEIAHLEEVPISLLDARLEKAHIDGQADLGLTRTLWLSLRYLVRSMQCPPHGRAWESMARFDQRHYQWHRPSRWLTARPSRR